MKIFIIDCSLNLLKSFWKLNLITVKSINPPAIPEYITDKNGSEVRILLIGYWRISNFWACRLFSEIKSSSSGVIQDISEGEFRQKASQIKDISIPEKKLFEPIRNERIITTIYIKNALGDKFL